MGVSLPWEPSLFRVSDLCFDSSDWEGWLMYVSFSCAFCSAISAGLSGGSAGLFSSIFFSTKLLKTLASRWPVLSKAILSGSSDSGILCFFSILFAMLRFNANPAATESLCFFSLSLDTWASLLAISALSVSSSFVRNFFFLNSFSSSCATRLSASAISPRTTLRTLSTSAAASDPVFWSVAPTSDWMSEIFCATASASASRSSSVSLVSSGEKKFFRLASLSLSSSIWFLT